MLIDGSDIYTISDLKNLKSILKKLNASFIDSSYDYINTSEYQNDYLDTGKKYDIVIYSYKHNFNNSSLNKISPKELEYYNQNVTMLNGTCGVFSTIVGGSIASTLSKKKKKK